MASKLDQAVKGAPPPNVSPSAVAKPSTLNALRDPTPEPIDPTSLLPSSPPQIYLNLLILEASLRAQYLHLLSRRRQNTASLTLLAAWLTWFFYAQFFRPRNDGPNGEVIIGGSPYWVVDTAEKMALTGGVVLAVLFWATGQWERGVRWPRRWIAVTNRGLRGFNCKVVVLRGMWWREMLGGIVCLALPLGAFWPTFDRAVIGSGGGGEYAKVEYTGAEKRAMLRQGHQVPRQMEPVEEDVAPGGDTVKLLLLPKPFSADFRENWEIFRTEYWETENARRAELRKRVRQRQRDEARREGGWLWWTGWRGWKAAKSRSRQGTPDEMDRGSRPHSHTHSLQHQRELKERRRRSSAVSQRMERDGSHSRSSSRSSTITVENENRALGSSSAMESGASRRRRPTSLRDGSQPSRPSPLTPAGSRPSTPNMGSGSFSGTAGPKDGALKKQASTLSTASSDSASSHGSGEATSVKVEGGTP